MPHTASLLTPLSIALRAALITPVLIIAAPAMAETYDGETLVFEGGAFRNENLLNGSNITYNNGRISQLTAAGSSVLTLNNSDVQGGGIGAAVNLQGATAYINGGTINSTNAQPGLNVGRTSTTTTGSTAFVDGTTITGGRTALLSSGYSSTTLRNSTLTGLGANGLGIELYGATANVISSTVTGQSNGVLMVYEPGVPTSTRVSLTDSTVVGLNGSAIRIDTLGVGTAESFLDINGSTQLQGSNGTMVELVRSVTAGVNVNGADLSGNITVDGTSTLNLNMNGSTLAGDIVVAAGGTGNVTLDNHSVLTGRLDNVAQLNINNQAQWVLVENANIADLAMNGGSVKFGGASDFYTLDVANLSGSGVFAMDVDFATGEHDQLNVANASGSHQLLIASTGSDPLENTSLHLVHTDAGDATFSLAGGSVDLGTWSYGLTGDGRDWYLDATHKTISPGTASVLALFNTAPTVWYGELSSLRSRMGELRHNGGQSGAWSRVYGAKYNVSGNNGLSYSQQQNGFSLGADAPLPIGDGQWLVGVLAGHSDSDLSLARGSSGTVKSYYAGAYTTWLDAQSGYYFDGVLKFNRFDNDSKVNLSDGTRAKGSYANNAVGASAEFGRHIKLDDGYFVEPSAQLATVFIQGRNYSLDNGLDASGERTRSLLGKLGATAGKRFDLGEGRYAQPYVRAAYVHEFAKGNKVSVNDNSFNNDLSGSRGELGAGVSVAIADKWDVHADFQYTDGEKLSQPWGGNLGVRYSW